MAVKTWGKLSGVASSGWLSSQISMSGRPIWLDSSDGDDTSGDGTAESPYQTLSKGISIAADAAIDTIILKDGFDETVTSTLTLDTSKTGVAIIGEGQTTKAVIRNNVAVASTTMFDGTGEGVRFENINFAVTTLGANVGAAIQTGNGMQLLDCDFGVNQYSAVNGVVGAGGAYCQIRGCTFTGAGTLDSTMCIFDLGLGWVVDDCVFDGGGYGKMYGIMETAGVLGWRVTNCKLRNNAHIEIDTGSRGLVHLLEEGTNCSVIWTE